MIFENKENTSVEGGGVRVKIISDVNGDLSGSQFEIYDDSGNKVKTITTGVDGFTKTGIKDLELNKTYTIKQVKAPKGYKISTVVKEFKLTKNKEYYNLVLEFKNESKKGKILIEAKKDYNKSLKNGQFEFELLDNSGNIVAKSKNNKDGKIEFEIEYNASNIGFITYNLREKNGNDKNITYDEHEEEILVLISDEGEDDLVCTVEYDDDGAIFKNIHSRIDDEEEDVKPNKSEVQKNKKSKTYSPKTGDNIYIYYLIMLISSMGIYFNYKYFKKKRRGNGYRANIKKIRRYK